MKCPVCKDIDLVMSDRQGVEIDYCPSCRGVWLDRGELDKIIERSSMQNNSSSKPQYEQSHKEHYNKYDKHNQQGYHKKKKEGFLSEIFDFDF
ncbi:zf-TFIIB domain-containing protein [Aliarcobacter butzleri]|uniref:Zf-TFIIB domain-containing protein n=1 Tax=Aliarcobacter butzleri TaxID=28197 RepID=A0AAP4UZP8_9BACT|nr:zf-TFIIB domain-containing protein [Aliarcobacter butzleri]MCG3668532.1 zf-TFIIB domain-containing protein [Aliarcobacter butzleri]MCG3683405.1 zf-TFIIB domain-containing protein [Aliarcobacter butzleri]MCG3685599.1 zf-TFIIB domain-containing protein [Aliarcobacter butzleri]MCG3707254.1 zf-TFIIB domain-containing protein [Aliarcobacter butzleri]MCG3710122.1 zf-TFIIB domain-containing protein [Aliarcobacter butzleri]